MIVPVAVAVVFASVPLARGHLSALADVRLRAVWAALAALVMQIGIINVFERQVPLGLAVTIHLSTYALAGWFVLANRHIPGLRVIALGAVMNLIPIMANNGVMPASPAAARLSGREPAANEFANSRATPHAHLAWLGDDFAIPAGYPLANVFSLGDIVLVAGAAVTLHTISGSRLSRRRRARPAEPHPLTPKYLRNADRTQSELDVDSIRR